MKISKQEKIQMRRERVFLILSGFFLGAMVLLNVIGITRFVQIGPLEVAVGVLPYPLTFLCTDLVCELYGKKRANFLVLVGFILNVFVIAVMYLAESLPAADNQPPWQSLKLAESVFLADGRTVTGEVELFTFIFTSTTGAMLASMFAYLAAQTIDVQLFHFWKRLTKGRHLWLRNNASTLVSQLVDSVAVISITFGASYWSGNITLNAILILIGSNYLFKMVSALLDTGPFYLLVNYLTIYLDIDPKHPDLTD